MCRCRPENQNTNTCDNSLYYQCDTVTLSGVCKGLADVYYAAVRAFGGSGATPGRRDVDEEALKEYEHAVEVYNQLVKEAQEAGLLPALE